MFKHEHYIPVLKGKRAEFPALGALRSKKSITPLMEAVPSAGPDEIPRQMAAKAKWPRDSPYFVDLFFLDDPDDSKEANEFHPVRVCFKEVASKGQFAIPVTSLSRSPGYQSAVKQVISGHKRGMAIRLTADDFEETEELESSLEAALSYFKLRRNDIDLLLDAGSVANSSAGAVAQVHRAHIDLVPNLGDWRTLTVLSGAFPLSLAPLVRDQWNFVNRHDWRGWRLLVTGKHPPVRFPAFGDYAIAHPGLPPEGRATILAQLRYSTPDSWLIWKGGNVFKHPSKFAQFHSICKSLIARPEYRGPSFSEGDAEIRQKAATVGSPGNAERWRRIGTNHHIETVLEQIANLP